MVLGEAKRCDPCCIAGAYVQVSITPAPLSKSCPRSLYLSADARAPLHVGVLLAATPKSPQTTSQVHCRGGRGDSARRRMLRAQALGDVTRGAHSARFPWERRSGALDDVSRESFVGPPLVPCACEPASRLGPVAWRGVPRLARAHPRRTGQLGTATIVGVVACLGGVHFAAPLCRWANCGDPVRRRADSHGMHRASRVSLLRRRCHELGIKALACQPPRPASHSKRHRRSRVAGA